MGRLVRNLVVCTALVLCLGGFRPAAEPGQRVFNNFMEMLFLPSSNPDGDLRIVDKEAYTTRLLGDKLYPSCYAYNHCGNVTPAALVYRLAESVRTPEDDAHANYDLGLGDSVTAARFQDEFGISPIQSHLTMAARDSKGRKGKFYMYNAAAVTVAFERMYRKPDGSFRGIALQRLYDMCVKDLMRDCAKASAKALRDKRMDQFANEYLRKSQHDSKFEGVAFCSQWGHTLLGNEEQNQVDYPCAKWYVTRIPGILARRKIDGTLPKLLQCLATVLRDYDPEVYAQVKDVVK